MTDQEKPDVPKRDPQAPEFMRPQRPVLDEPLLEAKFSHQRHIEVSAAPVLEKEQVHETLNSEATQELKTKPGVSGVHQPQVGENGPPPLKAYSPYFPRGVYEDARAVEAYYGRGEPGNTESTPSEQATAPAESAGGRTTRWLVLAFAVLMILVLLFLALTDEIPIGIF
jgi:hypothetical protein